MHSIRDAQRPFIVKLNQPLHLASHAKLEPVLRSMRLNTHLSNLLRTELHTLLHTKHQIPCEEIERIGSLLSQYAYLVPRITSVSWLPPAAEEQPEHRPLHLVQFYKESESFLHIFNTAFKHSFHLQYASNTFLLQYRPGSLALQFLTHLAERLHVNVFHITPFDIYSKLYHGEKGIANFTSQLYHIANHSSPALIIMDHIESFLPQEQAEKDQFLIHEMLTILHSIKQWRDKRGNFKAVFVGMSPDLSTMDSFLRKRFDEELFIDTPSFRERSRIIEHMLRRTSAHQYSSQNPDILHAHVQQLTERTHGYTMSDLTDMLQKVTQGAMQRFFASTEEDLSQIPLCYADFIAHTRHHRPHSLKSSPNSLALPQMPKVSWEDIGGLRHIKQKLEQLIIWPIQHADKFRQMALRPPSGLLLYGPPGVGKTLIAKAVCTTAKTNFISVNIPDLIRAEIGESEKTLANIFRRAKLASPCVIFFDEIQAIFGDRSSVSRSQQKLISQLLLELDSLEHHNSNLEGNDSGCVLVIAATNVPHHIDPTVLRAKRLEYCIYVGPPDAEARKSIFQMQFKSKLKVSATVLSALDMLVSRTENFSGADVINLCQQAGLNAIMRGEQRQIEMQDFEKAFTSVKPGASPEYLEFLEHWKPGLDQDLEQMG